MICPSPNCGATIPPNAKFCPRCGTARSTVVPEGTSEQILHGAPSSDSATTCPACGSYLGPGTYRCPRCKIQFCHRCRRRINTNDEQYQCGNQRCGSYGKLTCKACVGVKPAHKIEKTTRQETFRPPPPNGIDSVGGFLAELAACTLVCGAGGLILAIVIRGLALHLFGCDVNWSGWWYGWGVGGALTGCVGRVIGTLPGSPQTRTVTEYTVDGVPVDEVTGRLKEGRMSRICASCGRPAEALHRQPLF